LSLRAIPILVFLCPSGRAMGCENCPCGHPFSELFLCPSGRAMGCEGTPSAPLLSCGDATGCEDRMVDDRKHLAKGVHATRIMAMTCANVVAWTGPVSPVPQSACTDVPAEPHRTIQ
jgi:hypothetical protein